MSLSKQTLCLTALAIACGQASAAGFQVNAQSAAGLGRAMAGDAVIADNASVLSRNPAAMALFDQKELSVGATYADISVDVQDVAYAGGPTIGSESNAADNKVIPNIYYIQPINEKWAYGLAAFTNYGTGTDVSSLANNNPLAPADLLGVTNITTMNLNASVSYRITEQWSLGFGIDALYGSGELTRESAIPQVGKLINVDADGWDIGGIVGTTFELNPNHRWGMSYRASPKFKASGTVDFGGVSFDDINIPVPSIFQIAGFHQLNETWAVHYTAQHTSWSDFDKITVSGNGIEPTLKEYNWKDSWLYSVGGTYTLSPQWTLRAGYMFDNGVVGETSSISIPDSDRQWYTGGATYAFNAKQSVDLGIAVVRGKNVTVNEESAFPPPAGSTVTAQTRSDAVYYSMSYNHKF
ncbi:aromatic hydrocarbon degradation protein [Alginatibacterium sediminis]|uniref:Aromatic hydrocarbon degradation protein n=1 Tax=Alginatibacterium sediminis TaxID=2164068 RepID=A0A420EGV7_9ALTE|nr:outer membrane protein transport protein [Alginatibacterium sediminis]RKF19907.1 aromatic hydrocarbon degradation protein [Alginatibacterium sediminis]